VRRGPPELDATRTRNGVSSATRRVYEPDAKPKVGLTKSPIDLSPGRLETAVITQRDSASSMPARIAA